MGLREGDKIEYGGCQSIKEGLGLRYYVKNKAAAGKHMKNWLRFAVAWWHTL